MRTIALMNQKGGVGKTTTTVNLGAALCERGRRVLLVDLDPQAHLTITYGIEPNDGQATLYEVIQGEAGALEAIRRLDAATLTGVPTGQGRATGGGEGGELHLLPGSLDLAGLETELADAQGRQLRLRDALGRVEHDYDYLLLDCPPSLGLLTINALAMAEEVLIPMQAHFLALQGFAKLLETTHLVAGQMNPRLRVLGVVLTMFDAQTRLGTDVVNELQGFFDAAVGQGLPWSGARLFDSRIRRNIKLAEAPSFGQAIFSYDTSSNGAADYRRLAGEVENAVSGSSVGVGTPGEARVEEPASADPALAAPAASAAQTPPALTGSQESPDPDPRPQIEYLRSRAPARSATEPSRKHRAAV